MDNEKVYFSRNPIVEAAVNLEIAELEQGSLFSIESLNEQLAGDYPTRETLTAANISITIGGDATKEERSLGCMFKSEDGKQVVQARQNGFTFSRLAPYDRWEPFIGEAKRTWMLFAEVAGAIRPTAYSDQREDAVHKKLPRKIKTDLKRAILESCLLHEVTSE